MYVSLQTGTVFAFRFVYIFFVYGIPLEFAMSSRECPIIPGRLTEDLGPNNKLQFYSDKAYVRLCLVVRDPRDLRKLGKNHWRCSSA